MPLPTPTLKERSDLRKSGFDAEGNVTATRGWDASFGDITAVTDVTERNQFEAAIEAALAADPNGAERYDPHPAIARALARTLDIECTGDDYSRWVVTVGYDSKPITGHAEADEDGNLSQDSGHKDQNTQADHRITVKVGTRNRTQILENDYSDPSKKVVNAADDPFDPPCEVERTAYTFTVTIWRLPADLDWPTREQMTDCVNETTLTIWGRNYPIGSLKVKHCVPEPVWETGAAGQELYFKIESLIEHEPGGWNKDVLNQGRREKFEYPTVLANGDAHPKAGQEAKRVICDETGKPLDDPSPLDATGKALAVDAAFTYLSFIRYEKEPIEALWLL